jgi:hypothetical protein
MTNKEAIEFLMEKGPNDSFMGEVDSLLSKAGVFSHILWTGDDIIEAFDQFDMEGEKVDDDLIDEVLQELDYYCFDGCEQGNDEIFRVVSEIMDRTQIPIREEREEKG